MTERSNTPLSRRLLYTALVILGLMAFLEVGTRVLFTDQVDEATNGPPPIDPETPNLTGDPYLLWKLKPGLRYEMGIVSAINTRGFRGPEWDTTKPEGVRRILAVGDSSVFGFGVEDEQVFTARVHKALENSEVINAGVPGYSTYQVINLLEMNALAYSPDLVVIGNLWSDNNFDSFVDKEMLTAYASFEGSRSRNIQKTLHHSALYRVINYRRHALKKLPEVRKVGWMVGRGEQIGLRRVALQDYATNLETITRMVHDQGGEVAFLILPNREDVEPTTTGPVAWEPYRQVMRDAAERHGTFVIDAPALFIDSAQSAEALFIDEMHPSATGHELIAQALLAELNERDWSTGGAIEIDAKRGPVPEYTDPFLDQSDVEEADTPPQPDNPPPVDPAAADGTVSITGEVLAADAGGAQIQIDVIRYGHIETTDPQQIANAVQILASTRVAEPGPFSLRIDNPAGEAFVVVYLDATGDGPSADDQRIDFHSYPVDLSTLHTTGLSIDLDEERVSSLESKEAASE